MRTVRRRTSVTKEYRFEAAHRLLRHPGRCKELHGHSYRLVVTVVGTLSPDTGMILDFGTLSSIIRAIIDPFDHSVILQTTDPLHKVLVDFGLHVMGMPHPPTAEYMTEMFAALISSKLQMASGDSDGLLLSRIEVWETETARAVLQMSEEV